MQFAFVLVIIVSKLERDKESGRARKCVICLPFSSTTSRITYRNMNMRCFMNMNNVGHLNWHQHFVSISIVFSLPLQRVLLSFSVHLWMSNTEYWIQNSEYWILNTKRNSSEALFGGKSLSCCNATWTENESNHLCWLLCVARLVSLCRLVRLNFSNTPEVTLNSVSWVQISALSSRIVLAASFVDMKLQTPKLALVWRHTNSLNFKVCSWMSLREVEAGLGVESETETEVENEEQKKSEGKSWKNKRTAANTLWLIRWSQNSPFSWLNCNLNSAKSAAKAS